MVLEEPDRLAGDEALEMILLSQPGDTARRVQPLAAVFFPYALPRIAEIGPQTRDLRKPRSVVGLAQLLGKDLRLRTQLLKPFIELDLIIEAMGLGVGEVHFSAERRHIAGAAEV